MTEPCVTMSAERRYTCFAIFFHSAPYDADDPPLGWKVPIGRAPVVHRAW